MGTIIDSIITDIMTSIITPIGDVPVGHLWILYTGFWRDPGEWIDESVWVD